MKKTDVKEYSYVEILDFIDESNKIENVYDYNEILQSKKAWDYLKIVAKEYIDLENILNAHKIIMHNLNSRIAGKLRDISVRVGKRICPSPDIVYGLINEWLRKYGKGISSAEKAKEAHIEFEHIHPFEDGNGRVGRLIYLFQKEQANLPFEIIYEKDKDEYYKWF